MKTTQYPLLTTGQVALRLAISTRTLHRWISEGRIEPVRFSSRCIKFKANDVERLIDEAYNPNTPTSSSKNGGAS